MLEKARSDSLNTTTDAALDLQLLSSASIVMLALPSPEALFEMLANTIRGLIGKGIVVVTRFDRIAKTTTVVSCSGDLDILQRLEETPIGNPLGMSFPYVGGARLGMEPGRIVKIKSGLYDLMLERLSLPLCHQVEKKLGLKAYYIMPFALENEIFGSVSMLAPDNKPLPHRACIEALISQSTIVLKNLLMEEERDKFEASLEQSRSELEERVEERTKELLALNQRLQESEERLRHLSAKLMDAQENERERIGRDVHDSLGQSLAALKFRIEHILYQLQSGEDRMTEQSLESLVPMIQESIREVRRIQRDLRHPTLDELGILATLAILCREFQESSGIKIDQHFAVKENDIPESIKTAVYRIVQEALNNAASYSEADTVHVGLDKEEGFLQLMIYDNGKGFDLKSVMTVSPVHRGLGLVSIKERAELSGGRLVIESAVGAGTRVTALWPCAEGLQISIFDYELGWPLH